MRPWTALRGALIEEAPITPTFQAAAGPGGGWTRAESRRRPRSRLPQNEGHVSFGRPRGHPLPQSDPRCLTIGRKSGPSGSACANSVTTQVCALNAPAPVPQIGPTDTSRGGLACLTKKWSPAWCNTFQKCLSIALGGHASCPSLARSYHTTHSGSHRHLTRGPYEEEFGVTILAGREVAARRLVSGGTAQATITGTVETEPASGSSLFRVALTTPASNGTYTIEVPADRARGQSMTLVARFLGKSPATRAITLNAGRQEIDFRLRDDPLRLDELVVTGVNEATSTKKLPFAVGRVSADQLQETPSVSALGGLAGKVAGVRVVPSSGDPGGAPSIRLRGATSIAVSHEPLVIIDGTITRASGPFGQAGSGLADMPRSIIGSRSSRVPLPASDGSDAPRRGPIFTSARKTWDGKLWSPCATSSPSFVDKRIPTPTARVQSRRDGSFP